MNPIFHGMVKDCEVVLIEQLRYQQYVNSFEGKKVELILRKPVNGRTTPENRYYFGVVVKLLSGHTGYTPDDIHSFLKEKFLSKIIVMAGKDERIPRSSTELTTVEWEQWMTEIREWASIELGLYICTPNEIALI